MIISTSVILFVLVLIIVALIVMLLGYKRALHVVNKDLRVIARENTNLDNKIREYKAKNAVNERWKDVFMKERDEVTSEAEMLKTERDSYLEELKVLRKKKKSTTTATRKKK